MRVLLTTWAWPSHYFPLVPLGWALRTSGHEVRVACQPALARTVERSGLPAVVVGTDVDVPAMVRRSATAEKAGAARPSSPYFFDQYLVFAEAMTEDLVDYGQAWLPDVIVHDPTTYAGPLAAAVLGVPAVRHLWGPDFMLGARPVEPAILAPMCERLGLGGVETLGDLTVDPCPPSLQVPADYPRATVRHIPYNGAWAQDAWRSDPFTRAAARPRVCVTWGATLGEIGGYPNPVRTLLETLAASGAETVAALSEKDARTLGTPPEGVMVLVDRPLTSLLPHCDLLVHQGGPGTMLSGLAHGVPQLIVPTLPDQPFYARQLLSQGAGLALRPSRIEPAGVRERAERLLDDPTFRTSARRIATEIREQPPLTAGVAAVEGLVSV
ncbi:nucleotide disphospho-sugar-binding domain-containing protein [Nocardiopsis kunsanensis]|uniref:nucleotide disphospho-sugar-binding domain-containing protein n=1 Tax=Nocardiopsis kunsanensis TaxID=141693 RepID=UPI00034CC5F4|nr:nucleotide disphospho-sugar-binding domain-containing protein [Nocardiopsis kunsanensis]